MSNMDKAMKSEQSRDSTKHYNAERLTDEQQGQGNEE
jgi:hypothetical protein